MINYAQYDLSIQFRDKIYGGLPKDPALMAKHAERLAGFKDEKFIQKLIEEVSSGADEELTEDQKKEFAKKSWTGFKSDDAGLYISDYMIKANMKVANDTLRLQSFTGKRKQTLQHGVFVEPVKLYLMRDRIHEDAFITEPDGFDERAGTVTDVRTGQKRSIIRLADFVQEAMCAFRVRVICNGVWSENEIHDLFEIGQEIGLGSLRSFEAGKYDITEFETTAKCKEKAAEK